jgi:hypothetical protein
MKSDESILNIALAAVRRHSIDLESWNRTTISKELFLPVTDSASNELPVVQFVIDDSNWTQVTTQRVTGSINSVVREVALSELDDSIWGDFKNLEADRTQFRLVDFHGTQNDFWIETGKPSMGIICSINTIAALYKAST